MAVRFRGSALQHTGRIGDLVIVLWLIAATVRWLMR